MDILEVLENNKIIKNMSKRINYQKNPRFEKIYAPISFSDIKTR